MDNLNTNTNNVNQVDANTPPLFNNTDVTNNFGAISPMISTDVLAQSTQLPMLPQNNMMMSPAQYVAGLPVTNQQVPQGGQVTQGSQTSPRPQGSQGTQAQRLQQAQDLLLGRSQAQQQLEQQSGLPVFNKELADLQGQYETQRKMYQQAAVDVQGKPIGIERQTGKIAQIERNEGAKLGIIGAQILATQGNIKAATAEVDRAIKFQFEPVEQRIANLLQFQQFYNNDLTESQKLELSGQISRENAKYSSELAIAQFKAIKSIEDVSPEFKLDNEFKQVKAMDADPEFMKLKGNSELRVALKSYESAVKEDGAKRKGRPDAAKLDALYQEVLQAYRAAKNLGALQGPDFALVEDAIKRATFEKTDTGQLLNIPTFGIASGIKKEVTRRSVIAGIDTAFDAIDRNNKRLNNVITAKNPNWVNTSYYQTILEGESSEIEGMSNDTFLNLPSSSNIINNQQFYK